MSTKFLMQCKKCDLKIDNQAQQHGGDSSCKHDTAAI